MTSHPHEHPQLTIWDELGGEPRSIIKPSGWVRHLAQQIDPDAQTDAEVAAIVYPRSRLYPDGLEPRSTIKPSAWDYHWAQQIDPDAETFERVAAIVYPHTRAPGASA